MTLTAGARLGPYEVVDLLGSGGMGEVYRARDPRLGREVAVKVVSGERSVDPGRLARFEREARAVAALNHPNVLTVHDVGAHEGAPYVVTELLEGETLRARLKRHRPSERQTLALMVQAARGLEAAHARGIVHRDLKPENLFVTREGWVKVLDFGLAKLRESLRAGSVEPTESSPTKDGVLLGTVGYMSPEQVRGLEVDARGDVFSLGVVLYEALSGKHPFRRETTVGTLSAILETEPADLSSVAKGVSPAVSLIVRRCLEKEREGRYASAHELVVALEAVSGAAPGAAAVEEVEERSPYPGLSAFTEKDTAVFFGREGEVEALWRKLRSRHLLAVIGPSGAGKSSFVRAGVLPSRPEGWAAIVCTPGRHPFRRLGQALGPELTGDTEALGELAGFEDPGTALSLLGRWRKGHDEALVVVDQLEELFTQTPPESQAIFADLLGRLAKEADVHVLLSLRDDFLMRCHQHEPLARVFSELTPLDTLSREGLRRAIAEPAKRRGCALEDEALVDEMVDSVEGARGALPLLAFAMSQLWERRDREAKRLTRAAYEEIGGVAGALAQHAEHTLERIGLEREPLVRELFRNLVTAQWTRAAADREELLSVLPDREAGGQVLGRLIDARLLTSYEVERELESAPSSRARSEAGDEGPAAPSSRTTHRIEIVHESLLKAWPRLVRWQAQDEEGAVLRDQLKQAAHLWDEKGRMADLLWTGTAYQEYVLWRGRYPGALTALEEGFAAAMADRAARQRRRRQAVVAAVVASSLAVATVTGVLWKRARDEALRSEAGKLLALGRNRLESDTTAALAYARASLGLFDTPEARTFALEALWHGPVARLLPLDRVAKDLGLPEDPSVVLTTLSPDGRWLATQRFSNRQVVVYDRDGSAPRALPQQPDGTAMVLAFGPKSDLLVTGGSGQSLRLWSLPELRVVRTVPLGGLKTHWGVVRGDTLYLATSTGPKSEGWPGIIQALRLPDGEPRTVGINRPDERIWSVDPTGRLVTFDTGGAFGVRSLDARREWILGSTEESRGGAAVLPDGDRVVVCDESTGEIRIRSLSDAAGKPLRVLRPLPQGWGCGEVDREGRRLLTRGLGDSFHLWDLEVFPDARPSLLGRPGQSPYRLWDLTPGAEWLVSHAASQTTVEFWELSNPSRRELPLSGLVGELAFTADGRWLATCRFGAPVRLWPLKAADGAARDLDPSGTCQDMAVHPADGPILVGTEGPVSGGRGAVLLLPLTGAPPRVLLDRSSQWGSVPVAFDPSGRRAAAAAFDVGGLNDPADRILRVWDLPSGREQVHSVAHLTGADWPGFVSLSFAPDGSLYTGGMGGVSRLRLPEAPGETVQSETVYAAAKAGLDLSRDGTQLLVGAAQTATGDQLHEELLLIDLEQGTSRRITTHGARISSFRLSPSGRAVVTGSADGTVRVGRATGEEPHLLLGHKGHVLSLALSPDERWIASASNDVLYVWPMPDVAQPPLHTLPRDELLARLESLTNLRVVRDESSPTGWTLDIRAFPGWKDVPTW